MTHLLVATDELTIRPYIYDVGPNRTEIKGTRRKANVVFKKGSRRVVNFEPEAKLWISEKLVLVVQNLSRDRVLTPHDFGAIMRIDADVNSLESPRYDGSHYVDDLGRFHRIPQASVV